MEVEESAPSRSLDGAEASNVLVIEERFGGLAPEGPDHQHRLLRLTYYVKPRPGDGPRGPQSPSSPGAAAPSRSPGGHSQAAPRTPLESP